MAWLPIPSSLIQRVRGFFSGGVVDIIWKISVSVFLIVLFYTLARMGLIGGAIASMLAFTLFSETVRKAVVDLWNRDFWEP